MNCLACLSLSWVAHPFGVSSRIHTRTCIYFSSYFPFGNLSSPLARTRPEPSPSDPCLYGRKVEVGRNIRSASAFKCKRKVCKTMQPHRYTATATDTDTHSRWLFVAKWKPPFDPSGPKRLGGHVLAPRTSYENRPFLFLQISHAFSRCSRAKFKHFAIQRILAAPSLIVDATSVL